MHPFEKFEQRFGETRSVNGHKGWLDFIKDVLPAVLPLILDCFNPTPEALKRPLFNRTRLAINIKRRANVTWQEAYDAADDCFAVAKAATDEELREFIQCCK